MTRRQNLTSVALLDHVRVQVEPSEADSLPTRAYLADEAGEVTLVDLPPLSGAVEHQAAGAILAVLMREHSSAVAVLQIPYRADDRAGSEGNVVEIRAIDADGAEIASLLLNVDRQSDSRGRSIRLTR